jgi:hypothetical protein
VINEAVAVPAADNTLPSEEGGPADGEATGTMSKNQLKKLKKREA